ncbi:MAG: hypothetical protein Ct9H300mP16_08260 [Pseudomonadota bacterium]|nr:MAG: hypothetical protein Ct9H300mP16_08260 [Pseudomonadota bacterium]
MLSHTLSYAASLVPEIADDVQAVDEAMKNGYAWKWGPFELIDKLGPTWFAGRLADDGMAIPDFLKSVGEVTFTVLWKASFSILAPTLLSRCQPARPGCCSCPTSNVRRTGCPVTVQPAYGTSVRRSVS